MTFADELRDILGYCKHGKHPEDCAYCCVELYNNLEYDKTHFSDGSPVSIYEDIGENKE